MEPVVIDVGEEIRPLEIHDVDGDGRPDLLTGSRNAVVVLRGLDGAEFGPPQSYGVGLAPVALVLDDFDEDGRVDCAAANLNSRSVSILRGVRTEKALFRRGDADAQRGRESLGSDCRPQSSFRRTRRSRLPRRRGRERRRKPQHRRRDRPPSVSLLRTERTFLTRAERLWWRPDARHAFRLLERLSIAREARQPEAW